MGAGGQISSMVPLLQWNPEKFEKFRKLTFFDRNGFKIGVNVVFHQNFLIRRSNQPRKAIFAAFYQFLSFLTIFGNGNFWGAPPWRNWHFPPGSYNIHPKLRQGGQTFTGNCKKSRTGAIDIFQKFSARKFWSILYRQSAKMDCQCLLNH